MKNDARLKKTPPKCKNAHCDNPAAKGRAYCRKECAPYSHLKDDISVDGTLRSDTTGKFMARKQNKEEPKLTGVGEVVMSTEAIRQLKGIFSQNELAGIFSCVSHCVDNGNNTPQHDEMTKTLVKCLLKVMVALPDSHQADAKKHLEELGISVKVQTETEHFH